MKTPDDSVFRYLAKSAKPAVFNLRVSVHKTMRALSCLILSAALASLSACAPPRLLPLEEAALQQEWQQRRGRLLALEDWRMKARIGLKTERQAVSATLDWRQQRQDYRLLLIAPFGRGNMELSARDGVVNLRTQDNRRFSGDDAAELLQRHFGWDLPLTGLPYWIRGLPQPGPPVDDLILNEQKQLKRLSQSGWNIHYSRYRQFAEYSLPVSVRLENGDLRVRLAVKSWVLE